MTEGVVHSKGSKLYFADPLGASSSDSDGVVIHYVACPTSIPDITSGAKPRQDKTCITSLGRQYYDGLADPPEIAVPINFIPRSASHQALIALKAAGSAQVVGWLLAIGAHDTPPTTVDSDGYIVSPGPTTVGFKGYVSNFVINAAVGEIWKGTVTLQLQLDDDNEDLVWDLPSADLP